MKNPPVDAGGTDSIPGLGRSHRLQSSEAREAEVLSPRALEPELWNKRSRPNEKPDSATRE